MSSPTATPQTDIAKGFGSFRLGGVHMALPLKSMREVVPCSPFMALPSQAAGLKGGMLVRGVVVPVLDLRSMIGQPSGIIANPCVVIMVHGGKALGLLAECVTGVFTEDDSSFGEIAAADQSPLLFSRCLRASDGSMVSVLSPESIAALPGLPMVDDPEPERGLAGTEPALNPDVAAVPVAPMMLVRCAGASFALDTLAVHSTLAHLSIDKESPLAWGACRGVIEHAGGRIAAVDLLQLCGLGSLDPAIEPQAFVMQFAEGLLAFLVERVIDIRQVDRSSILPIPAFALQSTLFAGVLPDESAGASAAPHFVMDTAAMLGHTELAALASTSKAKAPTKVAHAASSSMLTYTLEVETATPLEQVTEILPYQALSSLFEPEHHGSMRGVLVQRGRTIPVLCLSQLTNGVQTQPTPTSSVLVVESDGDFLGFVVPALKAIEPTRWQPRLGHIGKSKRPNAEGDATCTQLALMGEGAGERMIPVLDLKRLARSIQARAAQARTGPAC
jgi:purine-binding chemotaxis protein CheW